ncbi:MAG: ferrous iron transport protein A [Ramlibacter sp.]|nr:ferrous iron transport protein A [Ramlibacter sp.]MCW5651576.1 ferrous iron transport protein A [Ramlibacter sp.]
MTRNPPPLPSPLTLDQVELHAPWIVAGVRAHHAPAEWQRWLEDIGFVPGEQVVVARRALMGGDPLVVRIGQSTFALRRAEAACIHVDRPVAA